MTEDEIKWLQQKDKDWGIVDLEDLEEAEKKVGEKLVEESLENIFPPTTPTWILGIALILFFLLICGAILW